MPYRIEENLEELKKALPSVDFSACGAAQAAAEPDTSLLTPEKLASYIDHTILKPEATAMMVDKLCDEAAENGFFSVCVNPTHVKRCALRLDGTDVAICTVIGFPLGASTSNVKAQEVKDAIANGAGEVDMVINVGALKSGDYKLVYDDIASVVRASGISTLTKVIIETCLLTDDEKVKACLLAKAAGADFVKTSTGFSTGGATASDIALMRAVVGPSMGVKASGGIRDTEAALSMIRAGASRIGASAGIAIIRGLGTR